MPLGDTARIGDEGKAAEPIAPAALLSGFSSAPPHGFKKQAASPNKCVVRGTHRYRIAIVQVVHSLTDCAARHLSHYFGYNEHVQIRSKAGLQLAPLRPHRRNGRSIRICIIDLGSLVYPLNQRAFQNSRRRARVAGQAVSRIRCDA
jgi:hypothetical protein